MKPGSRAEFEEWIPYDPVTVGHVETRPEDVSSDHPAAVLWILDPEQRHGWREFYVKRPVVTSRRTIGFRR